VILPGWRVEPARYHKLTQVLTRRGYQVKVVDLNEYLKRVDQALDLPDLVDYTTKQLASLSHSPVVIIGHSFGGRVGLGVAYHHPSVVGRLILTGTPGVRSRSKLSLVILASLAKMGRYLFGYPVLNRLEPLVRRGFYRIIGERDYLRVKGKVKISFQKIIAFDLTPLMSGLSTPTRLVWGEQDKIVPLDTAVRMVKLIPAAKLVVVKQAGHDLPYRYPGRFIKAAGL